MRISTTGALLLLAALVVGAAAAAPAPKTLKFTMTTVTKAQGMNVNVQAKVWVKGQKVRAETNDPMRGPVLLLVDGLKVRTLFPQRKQGMVTTVAAGKNGPSNPWEMIVANVGQLTRGAKKLGQEKVDGYLCDIYQKSQSESGRSATLKAWITRTTQPRLPIRVEMTQQVKRPNVTLKQTQLTRITNIQIGGRIPDSLFAVPAGYKIVEGGAPGVPGVPGGPGMGAPGMRP
jgi:hypothetical protein